MKANIHHKKSSTRPQYRDAPAGKRPKKQRPPLTRGQLRGVMALAIFLFVFGFAVIIFMAVVQDKVSSLPLTIAALVASFGSWIACVAVLMMHLGDFIDADLEKAEKTYSTVPLTPLHGVTEENVLRLLAQKRYKQTANGLYYKKKFCFWKDSITYYVALCHAASVSAAELRATAQYEAAAPENKNCCLLVFAYVPQADEHQQESLRTLAKGPIQIDTLTPQGVRQTSVPVLVEEATGDGYFLAAKGRFGISNYAYAGRLLKKRFAY